MLLILLLSQFSSLVFAQQFETNLQLYLKLAKSISNKLAETHSISAYPDSGNYSEYSILYNSWKQGKKSDTLENRKIRIDTAITEYSDLYRDGLFGDYYLVRKLKLIYAPVQQPAMRDSVIISDTLLFDNVSKIENGAFPFTKGNLPDEPFFYSVLEPIIYVGVTISVIYLLFITRS